MGVKGGVPTGIDPEKLTADIRPDDFIYIAKCFLLFGIFCASKYLEPKVVSLTLFDRGSPTSEWALMPVKFSAPLIVIDQMFLFEKLTSPQILHALGVLLLYGRYRLDLFKRWRKRYLLYSMMELQYHQPNVCKRLHRLTLLEFLDRASQQEFADLLLETGVWHGTNIRDPVKDLTLRKNKPDPTATAAWKMCIRQAVQLQIVQKKQRAEALEKKKMEARQMADIVYECANKAIDFLRRLPECEKMAINHYEPKARRTALRRFQKFVQMRRTKEARRVSGAAATDFEGLRTELAKPGGFSGTLRGRVLVCGSNAFGQTGVSLRKDDIVGGTGKMYTVYAVDGTRIRQIVAGPRASFYVTTQVSACGSNRCGELGLNASKGEFLAPSAIKTIRTEVVRQVASFGVGGEAQTLILTEDGRVFGCGRSTVGALTDFDELCKQRRLVIDPDAMLGPINLRIPFIVTQVACGARHSMFLNGDGTVWTCGSNRNGQLGQGKLVKQGTKFVDLRSNNVPTMVKGLTDVYLVACGPEHVLAASETRGLFSWGANSYGQCGVGTSTDIFEPTRVRFFADQLENASGNVIPSRLPRERIMNDMSGEEDDALASEMNKTDKRGSKDSSGNSPSKGLQYGHSTEVVRDLLPAGARYFRSLACGDHHSLVLSMNLLQVWGFGSNFDGQLGLGESNNPIYRVATTIPTLSKHFAVVQLCAAGQHSLALDRDGCVHVFGDNTSGQLGCPAVAKPKIRIPEKLASVSKFTVRQLATGMAHTLLLL